MTGGTKTPTPTEHEEQAALITWWSWYSQWMGLQRCLLMAIPNGGARTTVTGARLKAEGVRAGIPDLFLAVPTDTSHGLWLEMKRKRGGFVTDFQREAMKALEAQGFSCVVCRGFTEAQEAIVSYLRPLRDKSASGDEDYVDA